MGCGVARTFVTELSSHYTSTSPAMYASSLLSHSGHILGSSPIITRNFCHTTAYIDVHHAKLSSHYWMCGNVRWGVRGDVVRMRMSVGKCTGVWGEVKEDVGKCGGRYGESQHSSQTPTHFVTFTHLPLHFSTPLPTP